MKKTTTIPAVIALSVGLLLPLQPVAQTDSSESEDSSFLERIIQDALGGEGRDVRVIGLSGLLSSEASIEAIEVADADGVWISIRDVVLDWRRVALLRGRLEVEALTVGTVELVRTPLPGPAEPPALAADENAEPRSFALPELPVSVRVDQLSVGALVLREELINYPISLSMSGSAQLEGGEGNLALNLVRIDGLDGAFRVAGGFVNETRNLVVDLDVREAQGGLISTISGMPGAPSLTLTVKGDAPIEDFQAELALLTDDVERLVGTVNLSEEPGPTTDAGPVRVIAADVSGDVADLFLPEYREFFGRNITLDVLARQSTETGIDVEQLSLVTQGLRLDGSVNLSPQFLPEQIDISAVLGNGLGVPVVLPLPGDPVLVDRAELSVAFDETASDAFDIDLVADGIMQTSGLLVDRATIEANGVLVVEDGAVLRQAGADIRADLVGFSSTDPALWDAAGDGLDFDARVDWSQGQPLEVTGLSFNAGDVTADGAVTVNGIETQAIDITADLNAEVGSLNRFSAISGQQLGGSLSAGVSGAFDTVSGAFDVDLDGTGQDLSVGQPDADQLFAGETELTVSAARTQAGIDVDVLRLTSPKIDLDGDLGLGGDGIPTRVNLTGTLASDDGRPVAIPVPGQSIEIATADIGLNYDASTGDDFSARVAASGFDMDGVARVAEADVSAEGTFQKGTETLLDQVAATLAARVSGIATADPKLNRAIASGLSLDTEAEFDGRSGTAQLSGLSLRSGDLAVSGGAQASGIGGDDIAGSASVKLESGDLNRFAELVGMALNGRLNADVTAEYATATGFFDVDLDATGQDLSIGRADTDQLFAGATELQLTAARNDTGITVDALRLRSPKIDLGGDLALGDDFLPTRVDLAGTMASGDGRPVALPVPGQSIEIGSADIDLKYDAAAGDDYAINLAATGFDMTGVASVAQADISAEGTLQKGNETLLEQATARLAAQISGVTTTDPKLDRAISAGLTLNADANYDGTAGTAELSGLSLKSGDLSVSGEAQGAGIGSENMAGSASLKVDSGELNRFAELVGMALNGRLTADATAEYAMATGFFDVDLEGLGRNLAIGNPQVDQLVAGDTTLEVRAQNDEQGLRIDVFNLDAAEVDLQASGALNGGSGQQIDVTGSLRDVGLFVAGFNGPVDLNAVVNSANDVISVDGTVAGPGGITAAANGDVLRPDGTMDLAVTGAVPLGLANRILSPRSIEGLANIDVAVRGTPGLDAVSGTVTIDGARLSDPATRLALEQIGVNVRLENSRADLDVAANLSTGGQLTVTGPIDLTEGLPASIQVTLDRLNPIDPRLYDILIDGTASVEGPLAGGAAISGRINIDRAEIQIPSSFGGAGSVPDVVHVGEPASSLLTRQRAGLVVEEAPEDSGGGGGGVAYPLDIVISAPREVFIRGRGLDVEMGGEIGISGTTAALITRGGFQLIRGRLNILAQRLDFEEADISLQGDLVPNIRMVAVSDNGDIKAQIIIEGPINDPEIDLTSEPELPEDEVLAQLFFNKSVSELSPVELVQLASAINELSGGGGGVFGALRDGLGVDDLNVASDEEGNTTVTAGKYITERIYSDVSVKSDGTTRLDLNYELTKDIKARGGFDNEGNTGIGFTFERDF